MVAINEVAAETTRLIRDILPNFPPTHLFERTHQEKRPTYKEIIKSEEFLAVKGDLQKEDDVIRRQFGFPGDYQYRPLTAAELQVSRQRACARVDDDNYSGDLDLKTNPTGVIVDFRNH